MTAARSLVLIAALLMPMPLAAAEVDDIVAQLRAQGFAQISIGHTFLGRVRILANSVHLHREIVLNPKTGEILRDYTETPDTGDHYAGAERHQTSGLTTATGAAGGSGGGVSVGASTAVGDGAPGDLDGGSGAVSTTGGRP